MSSPKRTPQRMLSPRMAVEHNLKGLPKLIESVRRRLREWPEYPCGIDGALFRAQVEADSAVKLLKQSDR